MAKNDNMGLFIIVGVIAVVAILFLKPEGGLFSVGDTSSDDIIILGNLYPETGVDTVIDARLMANSLYFKEIGLDKSTTRSGIFDVLLQATTYVNNALCQTVKGYTYRMTTNSNQVEICHSENTHIGTVLQIWELGPNGEWLGVSTMKELKVALGERKCATVKPSTLYQLDFYYCDKLDCDCDQYVYTCGANPYGCSTDRMYAVRSCTPDKCDTEVACNLDWIDSSATNCEDVDLGGDTGTGDTGTGDTSGVKIVASKPAECAVGVCPSELNAGITTQCVNCKFYLRNDGNSMTNNWLLEIQPQYTKIGIQSFVYESELQICNDDYPSNVHKLYRLDAGQTGTLELSAPLYKTGTFDVVAFSVDRCCITPDGQAQSCNFDVPAEYAYGKTIKSGMTVSYIAEPTTIGMCTAGEVYTGANLASGKYTLPEDNACHSWCGDTVCDDDDVYGCLPGGIGTFSAKCTSPEVNVLESADPEAKGSDGKSIYCFADCKCINGDNHCNDGCTTENDDDCAKVNDITDNVCCEYAVIGGPMDYEYKLEKQQCIEGGIIVTMPSCDGERVDTDGDGEADCTIQADGSCKQEKETDESGNTLGGTSGTGAAGTGGTGTGTPGSNICTKVLGQSCTPPNIPGTGDDSAPDDECASGWCRDMKSFGQGGVCAKVGTMGNGDINKQAAAHPTCVAAGTTEPEFDFTQWIKDNPLLAGGIGIGVLVLLVVLMQPPKGPKRY